MALVLDDITVTVPDGTESRTILDRVSLHVERGETVVVSGESGSGKSTLLAVAGLLRRPDAGTVRIAGQSMEALGGRAAARARRESIGWVFQDARLLPALTAVEQVEFVAHLAGRLDRGARDRARELLHTVGLEDRADSRTDVLSGGERQRVALARALMNRPSLLLADEPTAAVDDRRGRQILSLLVTEAAHRQIAAVIVTHNLSQVPPRARHLGLSHAVLRPMA
jgi:hemin transport system ATP-binding protein